MSTVSEVRCVRLRWDNQRLSPGTALSEALLGAGATEGWFDAVGTASAVEVAWRGGTERLAGAVALRASGPASLDEAAPLATLTVDDGFGARTVVAPLVGAEVLRLDVALWVEVVRDAARSEEPARGDAGSSPQARESAPSNTPERGLFSGSELPTATLPAKRPTKVQEDVEYPEAGDLATHFLFGECEVVESDGERIRLKQTKDGRMREVSLSVLSVGEPSTSDGRKHFQLARKH